MTTSPDPAPETLPDKIEHLVDTDEDEAAGECGYYYNYLIYSFTTPMGDVAARSYLDDPQEVSIFASEGVDFNKDLPGVMRYSFPPFP